MKNHHPLLSKGELRYFCGLFALAAIAFTPTAGLRADDQAAGRKGPAAAAGEATPKKAADDQGKESKENKGTVDMVMERARSLMSKLDDRQRKVDPFGMSMDPENQVVVAEEEVDAAPKQVTSLEEAVARFRVSGVIPQRAEVIVGARSLGVGDRVLIEHKEVRFDLMIVAITAHQISLKDSETGEVASVDLGIVPDKLPVGASEGGGIDASTGIQPMNSAYQVEQE